MRNLVIVESPTKARTLSKFLGKDYRIEASMGHIRDLPKSELGIDVEHDFDPQYIIPRDKKKRVNELKKIADSAEQIWLASDPDREGEAIAWHLAHIISSDKKKVKEAKPMHRVVFHEITEHAVKEAFQHPRPIDASLVDAQQARRVLDRLVGYKLSPLLWKKVKRGLSAGRVQSVALRLIVEREREILAFKPVEYWSIEADLEASHPELISGSQKVDDSGQVHSDPSGIGARMTSSKVRKFTASLIEYQGKKLDIWSEETEKKGKAFFIRTQQDAEQHLTALKSAHYSVDKVIKKEVKRTPPPPFITSTLQQVAGNKLGFTAKKTMSIAQWLYERGLITYMRTDSVNLSPIALAQAREYITAKFGDRYLPASPRVFKTKSKNAQEAHEAIRPTNVATTADAIAGDGITRDHIRLYELIWKRMLASQIAEAIMDQTTVDVLATSSLRGGTTKQSSTEEPSIYKFRATGSIVKFDGWLKIYGVKEAEEDESGAAPEKEQKKQLLPALKEQEPLSLLDLKNQQHFTEPPPRYNDASLIKKLEELGIGRPSTYAPTLATIQERFYVERQERKLVPTALGMAVTDFLTQNFDDIVNYQFTANMEDQLDQIADGELKWQPTIKTFYTPFEKKLGVTEATAQKIQLETEKIDKPCPVCGKPLVVRFGKFGKFLACSGFPECKHTEPLEEKLDIPCPKCGGDIVARRTKKGRPFFGCKNYPKCDFASWTKPEAPKEGTGDRVQEAGSVSS